MQNNYNQVLMVILGAVVLYYVWNMMSAPQMPAPEEEVESFEEEMDAEQAQATAETQPQVNTQVGMVVDGPGYEQGGVQGMEYDGPGSVPSNFYFLDDGADGEMSIQHNLCSKSCCAEQWPTPFKQKQDPKHI